jgi:hypothetical protein
MSMMKTHKEIAGTPVASSHGFYIGLDLGQSRDYTALVILEKVWERTRADARGNAVLAHYLRYAKRYPLGTPYPLVVEDVKENYLSNQELFFEMYFPGYGQYRDKPRLIIDATGVGAAIKDEFEKQGIRRPTLRPVIITGGLERTTRRAPTACPRAGSWRRCR